MISPIFMLLPQVITFMGPHPTFIQLSKLTLPEVALLQQFNMFVTMNLHDQTVEDRFKRAVQELTKLAQSVEPSKSDVKLPFADFTYNQLRILLTEKILNNRELLAQSPVAFQTPMMMPPMGLIPTVAGGAPMGGSALPLIGGLNPVHALRVIPVTTTITHQQPAPELVKETV